MQLLVLSGLSGAGKSVALKALEDNGYACIDNLPIEFLAAIGLQLCTPQKPAFEASQRSAEKRVAITVDIRGRASLNVLPRQLEQLRHAGINVQQLFLAANTETLIKRFSETRRAHPLSQDGLTITEAIQLERALLSDLSQDSHCIDTSHLSANTLRHWVLQFASHAPSPLTIIIQSFGFKHGLPLDADFVFDARCLPNPYYDPYLRPLTGRDLPVIAFLEKEELVNLFYQDIELFLSRWLPVARQEQRQYLTIAIGCTGGQHRSVYLVERLARHLKDNWTVMLRHREHPNHAN